MTRLDHLLVCLAEECNEVAQRVTKALRFGLAEAQPGQGMNNRERIEDEVLDLTSVIELLNGDGVPIEYRPSVARTNAKLAKIEKHFPISYANGRLDRPTTTDAKVLTAGSPFVVDSHTHRPPGPPGFFGAQIDTIVKERAELIWLLATILETIGHEANRSHFTALPQGWHEAVRRWGAEFDKYKAEAQGR